MTATETTTRRQAFCRICGAEILDGFGRRAVAVEAENAKCHACLMKVARWTGETERTSPLPRFWLARCCNHVGGQCIARERKPCRETQGKVCNWMEFAVRGAGAGKCACGAPLTGGRRVCERCKADRRRKRQRAYMQERRYEGLENRPLAPEASKAVSC